MLTHKLYFRDSPSLLSLGMTENNNPRKNNGNHDEAKTPCSSVQGLKRRNFKATPVAKKILKEEHGFPEFKEGSHPALLFGLKNSKPGTSRNSLFESEQLEIKETKNETPDSALASHPKIEFDSDDCKFIQKFPYTYHEDEKILKYVLKGQNIFRVSSITLWKQLELKKIVPRRTYQSLKNRFLRNIKPNIFTTYKHLVQDKKTINKILIKFPELKNRMGVKNSLNINIPKQEIQPEEVLIYNTSSDESEGDEPRTESPTPITNGKLRISDHQEPISLLFQSHKTINSERTVTLRKDLIKISANLNKSNDFEVSYHPLNSLNERFKMLKKNNERVPCPTCGMFYQRPVVDNDSSETDVESDILIPGSVSAPRNSNTISKNYYFATNSNATNVRQKRNLISQSFSNSSFSRKLLNTLEKSNDDSDESNGTPEEVYIKKKDEVGISEFVEVSSGSSEKMSEENSEDSDSDIKLIYENTVGRCHKLLNSDKEKFLEKRCLHGDRDSVNLNTNWEQNLDSFFLGTSTERQTPVLTNVDTSEVVGVSKPSQKITKSSLASNMMKMLGRQPKEKKKS